MMATGPIPTADRSKAGGRPGLAAADGRARPLRVRSGTGVRKLIRAMEQFALRGRMFPEQVWDSPDVKSAAMISDSRRGPPCR